MNTPRETTYAVDGRPVTVLEWGPPQAELLVALHGYPDTAWTWRRVAPPLAQHGFRVAAPFLRGYGLDGLAPDDCYQVGAGAADLLALGRLLSPDRPVHVVGHDWGAIIAYCAATTEPERIASLTCLAVPPVAALVRPFAGPRKLWRGRGLAGRQLVMSWYGLANQMPWVSERVMPRHIEALWAAWSPGYDAAEDLRYLHAVLPTTAHWRAALRYYRALAARGHRSGFRRTQRHRFSVPPLPLLYLHGVNDGCISVGHTEGLRDRLAPGSEVLTVEHAGHFLQLEQPGIVAEAWLRRRTPSAVPTRP